MQEVVELEENITMLEEEEEALEGELEEDMVMLGEEEEALEGELEEDMVMLEEELDPGMVMQGGQLE